MRAVSDIRAASVLAQTHVAHPVQAIFDAPVAAIVGEKLLSSRPCGKKAGDGVRHFHRHLPLDLGDVFNPADLLETGPIEVPSQTRTGLQMPLGNAAMLFVRRAMFRELLLSRALEGAV